MATDSDRLAHYETMHPERYGSARRREILADGFRAPRKASRKVAA
jgi:hypothetical protein